MSTERIPKAPFRALLLLLVAGLAACDTGTGPINGGRVRLTLSAGDPLVAAAASPAATGDWEGGRSLFESANVTFSSILARNFDGELVDIDMDLPVTIDIVAMDEGGRTVTLPDGVLPPATYDQVVVVMTEIEGVLRDGTTITVTPPGGGWTAVVPVCPFDVTEDETAVVGLMLPVRRSLSWHDGHYRFEPRFWSRIRCDVPDDPGDTTDDGDTGDGGDDVT
ncbi:MAG: DUF4382 domain-containing protein [Gemmatimonadota bacterium]|jgi:hypothetical protein